MTLDDDQLATVAKANAIVRAEDHVRRTAALDMLALERRTRKAAGPLLVCKWCGIAQPKGAFRPVTFAGMLYRDDVCGTCRSLSTGG